MPSCASRARCARASGIALGLAAALATLGGCQELNPHFDPDGGPLCVAGERSCGSASEVVICTSDATGFDPMRTCYDGSHCDTGLCLPDAPAAPCDRLADCTAAGTTCTVLVDPAQTSRLGTFCLEAPNPLGRVGGQACTAHDQCLSGWCFRSLCFEACADGSDCTNPQHRCRTFDVTVDGVRDNLNVLGCAP